MIAFPFAITPTLRAASYAAFGIALFGTALVVKGWDENRFVLSDKARDTVWELRIEKANAALMNQHALDLAVSQKLSEQLAAERDNALARNTELENANANLPDAKRIGLSRGRSQLLRKQNP